MSYKSPIDVKALAKKGIFNEDRFFDLLAEQNNYIDRKTAKDFYMGLVRLLTQELRKNGVVRLPHLGDMALVRMKDKMGWAGSSRIMITGKYMLSFYPNNLWRRYFAKLGEKTGREGALDPREKVLNREL